MLYFFLLWAPFASVYSITNNLYFTAPKLCQLIIFLSCPTISALPSKSKYAMNFATDSWLGFHGGHGTAEGQEGVHSPWRQQGLPRGHRRPARPALLVHRAPLQQQDHQHGPWCWTGQHGEVQELLCKMLFICTTKNYKYWFAVKKRLRFDVIECWGHHPGFLQTFLFTICFERNFNHICKIKIIIDLSHGNVSVFFLVVKLVYL